MNAVTAKKPTYLYPGKVRDWMREQVQIDKELYKKVNSNKWVDRSWAYHALSDRAIAQFRHFLCTEIQVKHFDRLALDYVDGQRMYLSSGSEAGNEWPRFDPDKFSEGEFYID